MRRFAPDAIACVAILAAMLATHLPLIHHGIAFNDSSWYFHFGRRALAGDVPFRDYVFQVGPLPIYVDAGFQAVFGSTYVASLVAALTVTTLRVWVVWMLARRLAGPIPASLFAVYCGLDPTFASGHHWSWQYAQLFGSLIGLGFVLAQRATGRAVYGYLALAGAAAGLIVTARQATWLVIAALLFAASAVLLARREWFDRRRFIALWAGFAVAMLAVVVVLALGGALGPAIQQLFLDAGQKKGIHGISAVLDALFGGALVDSAGWLRGLLYWLTVPVLVVGTVGYLASRGRTVPSETVALFVVFAVIAIVLLGRDVSIDVLSDLPRTLLTGLAALVVLSPRRVREWFGVEPILAVGLCVVPLAATWAVEMSVPGRGWSDVASMIVGLTTFALASSRLGMRSKLAICGGFAFAGVVHAAIILHAGLDPFALFETVDGTLADSRFEVATPLLDGTDVSESRMFATDWLLERVPAGSSCFVYGTVPILYDILQCRNPTRIDVTIPDFITARDAEDAMAALRTDPPEFIIAEEASWMNPPLNVTLGAPIEGYSPLNPKAAKVMYDGLRTMLVDYEDVGYMGDLMTPALATQAQTLWDHLQALRLYQRRRR